MESLFQIGGIILGVILAIGVIVVIFMAPIFGSRELSDDELAKNMEQHFKGRADFRGTSVSKSKKPDFLSGGVVQNFNFHHRGK